MANQIESLSLLERNDHVIAVTVTDADTGQALDISGTTGRELEFVIKASAKALDTDGVTLSTATGEITVTDGPGGTAEVFLASTLLPDATGKFLRLDVVESDIRKTVWWIPKNPVTDL